jgi:hypothetical protein
MLEDLNRNGMGGVVEAVYATTLLYAVSLWTCSLGQATYAGCAT